MSGGRDPPEQAPETASKLSPVLTLASISFFFFFFCGWLAGGQFLLSPGQLPTVSEQEARAALLGLVAEHCCWGRAAARHMAIGKITSTSAFHYEIQVPTFWFESSFEMNKKNDDSNLCLFFKKQNKI